MTTCLEAKNYTNVVNIYVGLRNLQPLLKNHLEIDTQQIQETVIGHVSNLYTQALDEIKYSITSNEKFFDVSQLKHFLTVLRTFRNHHLTSEEINEKTLQNEAKIKWNELIDNIPDNISILNKHNNNNSIDDKNLLSQLAKQMIKHYLIANELSLSGQFKKIMRDKLFEKIKSTELIYKLGKLHIAEFSNHYDSSVSASAKAIIETFPEFERINIEDFNKKAGGITFDTALERLTCTPENGSKNLLRDAYKIFQDSYSFFIRQIHSKKFDSAKNIQETKQLAESLSAYTTTLSLYPEQTAKLLARIFAHWTYLDCAKGYFSDDLNGLLQPHSTQILTILRLIGMDSLDGIKNHLAQVKTGEGKSISLGIISTLFALLGYQVRTVCYSSYLSARDQKAFLELFQKFGILNKISYCTIRDLVWDVIRNDLANIPNLVENFLKGNNRSSWQKIQSKLSRPFHEVTSVQRKKSLLLLDEVDVFFGSKFYGDVMTSLVTIKTAGTGELCRYIWNNKKTLRSQNRQEAIQQLMQMSCTQSILKEFPNLAPLLPNEIGHMLENLSYFPESGKYLYHAFPTNDKIGSIDMGGNIFYPHGYAVTFAYLYFREKGEIRSDTFLMDHLSIPINCSHILYSEMPKFFSLKLGLTATLEGLCDEENKILDDYDFSARSFIPSTFEKDILGEDETVVIAGQRDEYFAAIKKEIDTKLREKRACFVVFEETKDVNEFNEYLKNIQRTVSHYTPPKLLTEMVPDEEKEAIISQATFEYKITLMTRRFGRGIDFICRDAALVRNGGVHIILTFYPEMLTEEIQIKGRTCRQDDPGSIRKILFAQDLLKQKLIPYKMTAKEGAIDFDEFYNSSNQNINSNENITYTPNCKNWDAYLANKRQILYSEKFKEIDKRLETNKQQHQKSLDLAQDIESNNTDKVFELLKEFNR